MFLSFTGVLALLFIFAVWRLAVIGFRNRRLPPPPVGRHRYQRGIRASSRVGGLPPDRLRRRYHQSELGLLLVPVAAACAVAERPSPAPNDTSPPPPGRPETARPLPVPPQVCGATDAFSLIRTRAEPERSGSQSGSQRPQPPGDARPQPAHIRAARWVIERHQATHRDASTVPSKQRGVGRARAKPAPEDSNCQGPETFARGSGGSGADPLCQREHAIPRARGARRGRDEALNVSSRPPFCWLASTGSCQARRIRPHSRRRARPRPGDYESLRPAHTHMPLTCVNG